VEAAASPSRLSVRRQRANSVTDKDAKNLKANKK